MRFDLHMHSTCSDGSDSPFVLLERAKSAGLAGISITDHDTLAAYTPELFEAAKKLELELLVGVEISTESSVHILGYNVRLDSPELTELLVSIHTRRTDRNLALLEALKKRNVIVTMEELRALAPTSVIGRPHIAQIMIQKGYVSSMKEAFDRYLQMEGEKCTAFEAIDAIHKAGGKAVLAHPHLMKRGDVKKLMHLPWDGIECYYARFHKSQEEEWVRLAKEKSLIATGGSDYHGKYKPESILGSSWVDSATFQQLQTSV